MLQKLDLLPLTSHHKYLKLTTLCNMFSGNSYFPSGIFVQNNLNYSNGLHNPVALALLPLLMPAKAPTLEILAHLIFRLLQFPILSLNNLRVVTVVKHQVLLSLPLRIITRLSSVFQNAFSPSATFNTGEVSTGYLI